MSTPLPTPDRIQALHGWYCRNVMPLRLTPEVERLWFEWLKAGYTGPDLRDVIRYIRKQIALGKRNEGALKLTNLIQRSEAGFIGFDQDLGLARARANLNIDRRLEPAPDTPPSSPSSSSMPSIPSTSSTAPEPYRNVPARERATDPYLLKKLREAAE